MCIKNEEQVYNKLMDLIECAVKARNKTLAWSLIKTYQNLRLNPTLSKLEALYNDGYLGPGEEGADNYNALRKEAEELPVMAVDDYIQAPPDIEEIKRFEHNGFTHITFSVFRRHTVDEVSVTTTEFIEMIEKSKFTGMEFDWEYV